MTTIDSPKELIKTWITFAKGIALFLFASVLFELFGTYLLAIGYKFFSASRMDVISIIPELYESSAGLLGVKFFAFIGTGISVYIVIRTQKLSIKVDFGFQPSKRPYNLIALISGVLLVFLLATLPIPKTDHSQYIGSLFSIILTVLAIGVLVPVQEEIFYRGYLFHYISKIKLPGFLIAVIISIVFTATHVGTDSVSDYIVIFIVSFLATYLRQISGSIFPAIILHATYNVTITFT